MELEDEINIENIIVRRPLCVSDAPFEKSSKEKFLNKAKKCRQKTSDVITTNWWRKALLKFFPFVSIFRKYNLREDLVGDVGSGLTVGIMNIPQGMAYAFLASLGPVYGLYVSFFPIIVYFFFGTSKHVAIGTASIPSLLLGAVLDREIKNYHITDDVLANSTNLEIEKLQMDYKIQIAVVVTLLSGIFQVIMSFLRLGGITVLLSPALVSGFTTGAAVHVLTSQVKYLFDIKISRYSGPLNIIYIYIDIAKHITKTNVCAIIISIICIIILVVFKELVNPILKKRFKVPFPIELLLVIVATLVSHYANLPSRYSVSTVGKIPAGFMKPTVPQSNLFRPLLYDAFMISVVTYTITISMARIFAQRHDYKIYPNQELLALGFSNIISSFLNCFVCCASLSRSSVQDAVGGRTQLAGLVSCALLLVVLLAAGPLFQPLPKCVLASIIVVAIKSLFEQFRDLRPLWNTCKYDFLVWIVSFNAVVFIDVDIGLGVGVMFSLLTVAFRSHYSKVRVLGIVSKSELYTELEDSREVRELPGIKILKLENPLNHISRDPFKHKVYNLSGINPEKKKKEMAENIDNVKTMAKSSKTKDDSDHESNDDAGNTIKIEINAHMRKEIKTIILDCSAIAHMDSAGLDCLLNLMNDYKACGIMVLLAYCTSQTKNMLRTVPALWDDWRHLVFNTVHDAVLFHFYGDTEKLEVHIRSSNLSVNHIPVDSTS